MAGVGAASTPGLDTVDEVLHLNRVDNGIRGLVAVDSPSLSLSFLCRRAHLQESNHCEKACLAGPPTKLFRGQSALQKTMRCHFLQMSGGPGLSRLWKFLNWISRRMMSQVEFLFLLLATADPQFGGPRSLVGFPSVECRRWVRRLGLQLGWAEGWQADRLQ